MKAKSKLTLPFRAVRFGLYLLFTGQGHLIWKTTASTAANLAAAPSFRRLNRNGVNKEPVKLFAESYLASESPDHLNPYGTARNNKTNRAFVLAMQRLYKGKDHAFLDIGCAGGKLVSDFAAIGWIAAGIEGSDYSQRNRRAEWAWNQNLFTCDAGKPFNFSHKFDVITAWDMIEHLPPEGVDVLCESVKRNLKPRGIWIITTAGHSEKPDGVELHLTQRNAQEWRDYFASRGFVVLKRSEYVKRWQMMRHSVDGCEFVLSFPPTNHHQ